MASKDTLRISWILPASLVRAEVEAITDEVGVVESEEPFEPSAQERDQYAHAAFEPLTILVCSFALAFLAERLQRFVKGMKHGGLIIDLRNEPVTVREERALDHGAVYVVSEKGMKVIAKPEALDIVAAIKAMASPLTSNRTKESLHRTKSAETSDRPGRKKDIA
jgi:hypothetical protein